MLEIIKHFLRQSTSKNNEYLSIFPYLCLDGKLNQQSYFAPVIGNILHHDSFHTWHTVFILKHNLTFDCSSISQSWWMEALYGADLARLVSARFIFLPSTGAGSALCSAQTSWHSHQSIKFISALCSLGDTGWQPEWASYSSSSSSSPCRFFFSLCNMSEPQRPADVCGLYGFLSSGRMQDVFIFIYLFSTLKYPPWKHQN